MSGSPAPADLGSLVEAQPSRRIARRSALEWGVDRVWRFFCSVRMAIAEIAILAILVLVGTLAQSSVPRSLAQAVPATAPIVDRWYAWDVFHSFLFMALMTILTVAVAIGGIINRAPGIWSSIARPTIPTTHGFIRVADASASATSERPAAELAELLAAGLRANRYRVLTETRGDEVHVYADRWRFGKLGTFPFHVALILVLVGGIVGAKWGFRDQTFFLPEGSVRDVGHDTGLSVRLDRFDEDYNENGSAKLYRSSLTLYQNGRPLQASAITVNNPLTLGDVVFYQSGFGQAVTLKVTDGSGRVLFDDALPLGEYRSKTNPDAPAALLDLPPAGVTLTVIAPDDNPANRPDLDNLHLQSGEMYLMARPLGPGSPQEGPSGAVVQQGTSATFGNLDVAFEREKRFAVLQIARNPGIPIFLVASVMAVVGLAITFYFPHRRLRGIVSPASGGSRFGLAPMAKRDWGAQRAFERLVDELERRMGTSMTRATRTGDDGGSGGERTSTVPDGTG